jgi:NAD(P)H-dependent FMN reductase
VEANAGGRRNRTGRARGARLAGALRLASEAAGAARNRLEPTAAGRVWARLSDVGLIDSSLQFAVVFTLGFIPFLTVLSAALGPSRSRAVFTGSGLSTRAGHDFTVLFTNGRAAPASLSLLAFVLAVLGGGAVSHMLQGWYAKIFRAKVSGWKAMARRVEWLAGFFGFVALQVVIVRRIQPPGGHLGADAAQFLVALAFWWWSLHCLLAGQVSWRRLFAAGLATAVCCAGLAAYIAYVASISIVANEARYGSIGAAMTLLTAEIGLGVALQLGAAIGATAGRGTGNHPARRCQHPQARYPVRRNGAALKIAIILGSTRPNRAGATVAQWVNEIAGKRADAEFELIDVAELGLPLLDDELPPAAGQYARQHSRDWAAKVASFDSFVFVTPEYSNPVPAGLRNALDFAHAEWAGKAAGFISYGAAGGTRAVEHLRLVLSGLQVATVRAQLTLNSYTDFENFYDFKPAARHEEALNAVLDQVVSWGTALEPVRKQPARGRPSNRPATLS